MRARRNSEATALQAAASMLREREAELVDALARLQGEPAPLNELRARHGAVTAAYRGAIAAAAAAERLAPGAFLDRLGLLRTRAQEHLLSATYSSGLLVPTVVQTADRAALGPAVPGLVTGPVAPANAPRRYGLDLAADPVPAVEPTPLPVRRTPFSVAAAA